MPKTGIAMKTPPTMPYKRGDVVLVPYPFVERDASKKRPAVIVSSNAYNTVCPDIIIALVTSRRSLPPRPGDHRLADWRAAGLIAPSTVRSRLATLVSSRVIRLVGRLSHSDLAGVDRGLRLTLDLT